MQRAEKCVWVPQTREMTAYRPLIIRICRAVRRNDALLTRLAERKSSGTQMSFTRASASS
jgi:hypothetical protein